MRRSAWIQQAACADTDTEKFFPGKGRPKTDADYKQICNKPCPVRLECLKYAVVHKYITGVWGGLLPNERQQLPSDLVSQWEIAAHRNGEYEGQMSDFVPRPRAQIVDVDVDDLISQVLTTTLSVD